MQDMKPAFALDFRDDAIGLLHRTGAGWTQIGSGAVDDPDLAQALGYLRSTALGLSPRGIATKLIIPTDQILYLTLTAPGPDAAKRRAQIVAALDGRTPYDVADLVFDWSGSGPEVQVAVIARETLAEAAAFAAEHRFNPVSYVAVPDEGTYKGEPWFGPTEMAADLLAAGEKVDRDKVAVTIASRAPAPDRKAVETAAPETPTAAEPAAPRRDDPADPALGIAAAMPALGAAMPVDLPPFRAEDVPMRPSRPDIAADAPAVDAPADPRPEPMPEPEIAAEDAPREMSFAEIMAEARAELPVVAVGVSPATAPAPAAAKP